MKLKDIEQVFYKRGLEGKGDDPAFPFEVKMILGPHIHERAESKIASGIQSLISDMNLDIHMSSEKLDGKADEIVKECIEKKADSTILERISKVYDFSRKEGSLVFITSRPSVFPPELSEYAARANHRGMVVYLGSLNRHYYDLAPKSLFARQLGLPSFDIVQRLLKTKFSDHDCLNKFDLQKPDLCNICSTALLSYLKGKGERNSENYFRQSPKV